MQTPPMLEFVGKPLNQGKELFDEMIKHTVITYRLLTTAMLRTTGNHLSALPSNKVVDT